MKRSPCLSTISDVRASNNACTTPGGEARAVSDQFYGCSSPVKKRSKLLNVEEPKKTSTLPDLFIPENIIDACVATVQPTETSVKLFCKEIRTGEEISILLQGIWSTMEVQPNDHVRIITPIRCSNKDFIVNDERGMVIFESSELVSCTAITQAIFCRRKAIINQRFRRNGKGGEALMLGSIVHSLFQAAVCRKPRFLTWSWLLGFWRRELLQSYFSQMIALNISCEMMEEMLLPYIESIVKWVKSHMPPPVGCSTPLPDGSVVTDVVDIEENLWDPIIGIKGKVDVSIQVKKPGRSEVIKEPLELKTGKSQISVEHCGQVMLYCYSLSAKDLEIDGVGDGTLLYLFDGKTNRVRPKVHDLKGLLHLRNELASSLCNISEHSLPSPLPYTDSCKRCDQAVTCFFMRRLENQQVAEQTDSTGSLSAVILAHLSADDFEYFKRWISWTFMEWKAGSSLKCNVKDIWELSVEEREKKGTCIGNLKAASIEAGFQKSVVKFVSEDGSHLPLIFNERDMVVLSTNSRIAFAMGTITCATDEYIEVKVEVDNRHLDSSSLFILDRYDSSSVYPINLGNLTLLMQNDKHAEKLRSIIISGLEPKFAKMRKEDVLRVASKIKRLNKEQALVVIKSLMAEDYVVVEGFPGSGKTSTIAVLVECLVLLGRSVLITSFTHSSVDNLIVKICEKVQPEKVLRLGNTYRDELKSLTLDGKLATLSSAADKFKYAKEILMKTPVVACTCLEAASNVLFSFRHFSLAIIDEASQSLDTSLFPSLLAADVFVLVGDSNQLTPLVQSVQAQNEGMSVSLLERLKKLNKGTLTLRLQYRMNQKIVEISSKLFYDNQLVCANDRVANATLDSSLENFNTTKKFLMMSVSNSLDDAVMFIDTQSEVHPKCQFQFDALSGLCFNAGEMEIVKEVCNALTSVGVSDSDIGVISVYRYHAERIRQLLRPSIEVSTVDQFQGRDKSVIILSFVWTSVGSARSSRLLNDFRRINVALTRAKHKLILLGCRNSLVRYQSVAAVISMIPERNIVLLEKDDYQYD